MISNIILEIKNNRDLYNYLKYHSYWYKKLKNDENSINEMIKEMKNELKLTPKDKINDITNKIELIKSILDIIT